MLGLISDHNFNGRILRGLRRRIPDLDVVRTQDVNLGRVDDETLLEWAAGQDRVLITHDVNTIPGFAYDRVRAGARMPGVFLVPKSMPIGQAIDELALAATAQTSEECNNQVNYFPL